MLKAAFFPWSGRVVKRMTAPWPRPVLRKTKRAKKSLADRADDSAELQETLKEYGTKPVIPNKRNRKQPFRLSKKSYKERHKIENSFCRLKDFRRIATRYNRLAINFTASITSWQRASGGCYESGP
jgi:transposase